MPLQVLAKQQKVESDIVSDYDATLVHETCDVLSDFVETRSYSTVALVHRIRAEFDSPESQFLGMYLATTLPQEQVRHTHLWQFIPVLA